MHLTGSVFTNLSIFDRTFEVPWTQEALLDFFEPIFGQKTDLLQWNATTLLPDASERKKANIEFAHAVVFDKDCGDPGELDNCIKKLLDKGVAFWIHSSFSHKLLDKEHKGSGTSGPFDCFRVIIPLSRPVTPAEYPNVVHGVMKFILPPDPSKYIKEAEAVSKATGKPPKPRGWDPVSSSIAQFWYGPGCPEDRADDLIFIVQEGDAVDPDLYASDPKRISKTGRFAKKSSVEDAPGSKLGRAFEKLARALEKAGCKLDHEDFGAECRASCPLCGATQDSLCVKAEDGRILLKCFAECNSTDILTHIGLSWADLSIDKADALERAIQRAFGSDRTDPYTEAELAALAPYDDAWILQTPAGYFIREPGGDYAGPFQREHVVNKCRDLLAPASSAGVSVYNTTAKGGQRDKNLGELMRDYGQTPNDMYFSYASPHSHLEGSTFVQKAARPREFEPEFNPSIARWLELFAGVHLEALLDWLATLLDLHKPTCALLISGTSGAGKDLLIEGLAQIWQGMFTTVERATGRFTGSLLTSPVVVANEELKVSRDFDTNPINALKLLVSGTTWSVEQKFQNGVPLKGALRIVMASNQNSIFKLFRQPTESDLQALDERILLLCPPKSAKDFLLGLGGIQETAKWVDGGGIARHIMWLRKTRKVVGGSRFLVGGRGGMSELLSAEGKSSAIVLKAIMDALTSVKKDSKVALVRDDEVYVSKRQLMNRWGIFSKLEIPDDFGDVWRSLISSGVQANIRVDGQQTKFQGIQLSILETYCRMSGQIEILYEALNLEHNEDEL